jgi:hypothetical protein
MKANICRGETLREVLGTGDTAPPVQRVFEEPAERRQRLMSDLRAPVEVKGTAVQLEDPEVPEPVDDDADDLEWAPWAWPWVKCRARRLYFFPASTIGLPST